MIVCIEDDANIRELMIYTLNTIGFEAKGFASAKPFWEYINIVKPELILLDIMLEDEDGIAILKKLKNQTVTKDIPVIMATAKGTEYDKVIGLDLGADDYLAKPFGMMEMVARIKAVLRRNNKLKKDELKVSGLSLNKREHSVSVDGVPVDLTLKEYELLSLFMENLNQVFTRDILLNSIWGLDFVGESRTVDVHIATLRTKLKNYGECIKTVRGVGYRMEEYDKANI